ncbi:MAG: RNA polymerase sigma factor [Nannocystaceae bacterium]|nr:sigma-70 family RNA polymerase sigma factor [bacterium]
MTVSAGDIRADEPTLEPRLEALYRQHHGFVWSSLLRLGVPGSCVDDACQDVFLIVFRRLADFEGRSEIRTWLFAIARRVAFRHRRGAQRAERKVKALAAEPRRLISLEELFEKRRAAELVLEAMDALDEDKRAAIVMHVLEGMSGPQVAETLGLPVDTAYSRIKAGRRVLRARLSALGIDDDSRVYEAARRQTRPTAGARRRVAALLAARLGTAPLLTGVAWKVAAAVAVFGTTAFVGARALGRSTPPTMGAIPEQVQPDEPAVPPSASPAGSVAAPVQLAAAVEAATPSVRVRSKRRDAARAPTVDSADRLRDEVVLIGGVKAALDDGRASDAMRQLDEHARRFPEGELTLERWGYRAVALCALGKRAQGRGAGKTFVKAHPGSSLAGRVRAACGLQEEVETP